MWVAERLFVLPPAHDPLHWATGFGGSSCPCVTSQWSPSYSHRTTLLLTVD